MTGRITRLTERSLAIARTALLLVAVLLACLALVQAGGRLLFANLAQFEDRVNANLEKRGASIEGLAGSWRYLNPSVSAAVLRFAGGELEGLELELDVLESLWRNRFVARRLHVKSARMRFVRTPSGWQLGAEAGEMELDQFLRHSDELKLAGRVELEGYSATGAIYAEVSATNRGDRHRWRVMAIPESPQPGSARGHPSQEESPQPGSARGHPSQEKSPQPGSARGHPSQEESPQPGSARVSLAEKRSARVSLAEKRSARVSLAEESSARRHPSQQNSPQPAATRISLAEDNSATEHAQESCGCILVDLDLTVGGDQPVGAGRFLADGVSVAGGLAEALALPEFRLDIEGRWSGDGEQAAVVMDFHGTNVSGERQRPGTIVPWSTSGAGPEPSAGEREGEPLARREPSAGEREGEPLAKESSKPKASAVGHSRMSGGTARPLDVVVTTVARAVGGDSMYRGVASVRATAGEAALEVVGIHVSGDGDGVGFWFEDIDLAEVNALLASGLGKHGHWFDGVAAAGRMHAIRAHLGRRGLAYEARLEGISMSNYRGVPEVANGCGFLHGHLRSFRIDFRCEPLRFGLPRYFDNSWDYDVASGDVTFWFDRGYLGARGNVAIEVGGAAGGGGFSLTRPRDPQEGRFVLLALADGVHTDLIKRHLPQELGGNLRDWLKSSLVAGQLNAASTVYHGHTQTRPGLPNRRFEVAGLVVDGTVDYHQDWPAAEALQGSVTITGKEVRARVVEGVVFGGAISDSTLRAPVSGGYVDIALNARAPAEQALDFVRTTPLAGELHFVAESWHGDGALDVEGGLRIPIGDRADQPDLDLAFELDDVALDLVDLGLLFTRLNGSARFQSPHYLSATAIKGSLFGFPVHISSVASEEANTLDFRGTGTVADVYRILETREFPVAAGGFGFNAQFRAFADSSRAPELTIESDGVGIAMDLPPPLRKSADQPRRLDVELVFGDAYTRADVRGERFAGWFHTRDGDLVRGAVGIGVPAGRPDFSSSEIRLSGQVKTFRFEADGSALMPHSVPWRLDDLAVESVWLGDIEITDVMLNGVAAQAGAAIGIESNEIRGTVVVDGEKPLLVWLDEVRVPAEESDGDLLDVSVFDQVPDADVTIASTLLGDDDHGSWQFGIRRDDGIIRLTDLVGDIKGMRIEAAEDLVWTRESDTSRFGGRITAGDLALVLPQWGYAPSVESASVDIEATVGWPGSPLNFELGEISGSMRMAIDTGRFLEVEEAAGAKILALLNFTKVARRLTLDFSDLFGRGIGFDRVRANGELDEGVLSFAEPMEIHGPSSDFRINGTVDLADGTLNNEMVVTLPLSSSLPWYAVWLATTEPVSAVGVLLGRELFKEQINTLSSARYRITGTIEEPNPEFIDIFRSDMEHPETGDAE